MAAGIQRSKAAVHHLTRSLAAEWAPAGVRVNALAPGYIKTDMSPVDDPQYHRHWIEDTPQQRYATPDELGRPWCTWPVTPRASSPGRCCSSTAATPSSDLAPRRSMAGAPRRKSIPTRDGPSQRVPCG